MPGGSGSSRPAQVANRRFTRRSSREWYAMTRMRPPGVSRCTDSSRPAARFGSSRLTSIRIAWNVRRAGWRPRLRAAAGIPARIASTSSPVVRIGRAATMARAIRRANRSSPFAAMIAARSSSAYVLSTSAAVRSWALSMRMSSGASAQYEKPRSLRSSCGLLTPRSNKIPTMFPSRSVLTIPARSSNPPRTIRARGPNPARASRAAFTASGSRSMPRTRTSSLAASTRRACPPPPTVASTITPDGTGARSSTTSRPITG